MVVEKFTFANQDGQQLAARLDLPEGSHLGSALFAHCFTCSKDIPAAKRIAQRLAAQGSQFCALTLLGLDIREESFQTLTSQPICPTCSPQPKP